MMHSADTRAIEAAVEHRPWPLPRVPWILFQSWRNLLFLHWKVPLNILRTKVPSPLELDLYEGDAWVGMTPFALHDFRLRNLPTLPAISTFPELNLRTYVRANGRPGIHFFSLDAGSLTAVVGARTFFRLPYHHATMSITERDGQIEMASHRSDPDGDARFRASYRPVDHAFEAAPGTLEHFLTERYALFAVLRNGKVLETQVHHRPWPLQPAEANVKENGLPATHGLPAPPGEPLLHFSRRQDTLVWPPTTLEAGS